jgi:NAD(P)-dependent dehydrogenase (short-subunit alcohol dehydrogenase family)
VEQQDRRQEARHDPFPRVALVTGASQGLGRALAGALADRGWALVIDARRADRLAAAAAELAARTRVIAPAGDITDPAHREELAAAVGELGRLDLLVNNASTLGASPLPALDVIDLDVLRRTYEVNVVAPLALTQRMLPALVATGGTVLNITSDAAVEAYEHWGGYGSSKAALEHLSRVLAAEQPAIRVLVADPGDLGTEMHQDAFPGEDISDRPLPEASVPGLLALVEGGEAGGRYRVPELVP